MKCPRCQEPLFHLLCEACGREIPEESCFCCWCGKPIQPKEEAEHSGERVLCSDGTCIGVINEAGLCNICGKPLERAEG